LFFFQKFFFHFNKRLQLPYLLDLQLFLGCRLVIGSTTSLQPDYTSDIIVGCLPIDSLGMNLEWVKSKIAEMSNIEALNNVAKNGYKQYCKSRLSASSESYKRAKEIMALDNYTDVHFLFGSYWSVFFFENLYLYLLY